MESPARGAAAGRRSRYVCWTAAERPPLFLAGLVRSTQHSRFPNCKSHRMSRQAATDRIQRSVCHSWVSVRSARLALPIHAPAATAPGAARNQDAAKSSFDPLGNCSKTVANVATTSSMVKRWPVSAPTNSTATRPTIAKLKTRIIVPIIHDESDATNCIVTASFVVPNGQFAKSAGTILPSSSCAPRPTSKATSVATKLISGARQVRGSWNVFHR